MCIMQEIKKLFTRSVVRVTFLGMCLLAVCDALYFEVKGISRYAYLNWLLMPNNGFAIFERLFFAFCIAYTGLVFFHERKSSVYENCIVRCSRWVYFRAKIAAVFLVAFLAMLLPLLLNILVVFLIYPTDAAAAAADSSYAIFVPAEGSLAIYFYEISPFVMAFFFCVMNALAAALFSVFALGIQMIGKFKRLAMAFLCPWVVLYSYQFLCTYLLPSKYNLLLILQPLVSNHTDVISAGCWIVTYTALILLDVMTLAIGFHRNREAL